MKQYSTFIFDSYERQGNTIRLKYSLDDDVSFTETVTLPRMEQVPSGTVQSNTLTLETERAALFTLHLAAGVSYYKTCCPSAIEIRSGTLTEKQAEFWNTVYEKGLGEFFYRNQIDFRSLIHFPIDIPPASRSRSEGWNPNPNPISTPESTNDNRYLVPIGGGKDSVVTVEKLRKEGADITLLRMGSHPLIDELVKVMSLPCITIEREISPKLFTLNEQGALNGHIPITGVLSCLCVVVAELYGFRTIAMSNEKSANFGNVHYLGEEINHQWSKSEEFEKMFRNYIRAYIDPGLGYESELRRFSELEIVGQFAKYPQYFTCVSSCNKNWKIAGKQKDRWCGECPKCAFVFAIMAAHLPRTEIIKIFGKNLFEDSVLLPLYKRLLGLEGFKPFECVGTPEETKEAFAMIQKRGEFTETVIMKSFSRP